MEVLKPLDHIETHLIISNAAKQTIAAETDYSIQAVKA
ncbi:3-octaprenyl-4-hydroxybenzoate carboxy-lyase, partial [Pasteurella multocida subsp. multocida str. Anand1_cattle]